MAFPACRILIHLFDAYELVTHTTHRQARRAPKSPRNPRCEVKPRLMGRWSVVQYLPPNQQYNHNNSINITGSNNKMIILPEVIRIMVNQCSDNKATRGPFSDNKATRGPFSDNKATRGPVQFSSVQPSSVQVSSVQCSSITRGGLQNQS